MLKLSVSQFISHVPCEQQGPLLVSPKIRNLGTLLVVAKRERSNNHRSVNPMPNCYQRLRGCF